MELCLKVERGSVGYRTCIAAKCCGCFCLSCSQLARNLRLKHINTIHFVKPYEKFLQVPSNVSAKMCITSLQVRKFSAMSWLCSCLNCLPSNLYCLVRCLSLKATSAVLLPCVSSTRWPMTRCSSSSFIKIAGTGHFFFSYFSQEILFYRDGKRAVFLLCLWNGKLITGDVATTSLFVFLFYFAIFLLFSFL